MSNLYLTTPCMKGAAVRRWQEMLLALNYDLSPWGADGQFGTKTDSATRAFQTKSGLTVDGIVGPNTLAAAEVAFSQGTQSRPTLLGVQPIIISGVEVWDFRSVAKPPKNYSYDRPWSQITGIMLHRTACVLGETPTRYLPVNAHIGVTMGGKIVLSHAYTKMIWHGHGPSPWTIGIEFDGNPEGKPGYYWKNGGGPHNLTDEQFTAAGVLFELLHKDFSDNGQKIEYVIAHRQSSKDRESDPGWQCWQRIGIPWMSQTGAIPGPREGHPPTEGLELPVGYAGDTWYDGFQIPKEWDSRSKIPFWK